VDPSPPAAVTGDAAAAPGPADEAGLVFEGHDPELRPSVEQVLARYARALETIDGQLLAAARPDLSAKAREALIAEREGATNIASDLRVLDVSTRRSVATVTVRRTEVVVSGRMVDRPTVAETLRFHREAGAWVLRPSR
jgi:hypothetical protein